MKKMIFLFVSAITLISCSVEDDAPVVDFEPAAVTDIDLPETFERGRTYNIVVTYLLPSACHNGLGLDVVRAGLEGEDWKKIYVLGVSSIDSGISNCGEEGDEEELLRQGNFRLTIDQMGSYTFYLWQGVDDDGENSYNTVVVPVATGTSASN